MITLLHVRQSLDKVDRDSNPETWLIVSGHWQNEGNYAKLWYKNLKIGYASNVTGHRMRIFWVSRTECTFTNLWEPEKRTQTHHPQIVGVELISHWVCDNSLCSTRKDTRCSLTILSKDCNLEKLKDVHQVFLRIISLSFLTLHGRIQNQKMVHEEVESFYELKYPNSGLYS